MDVQEIVKESFGSVDALLQRGQRITGLATHYADLDEMTSGLQRADLIIIAARPSMGKTAFALNIAENAAVEDEKVVGVFSLEMSREALLLRLLCSQARVDSHKMRTGSLWREDEVQSGARHGTTGACADFHRRHARASGSAKCVPRRGVSSRSKAHSTCSSWTTCN